MSLLTDWREYAYNQDPAQQKTVGKIWEHYFAMEKELYIQLLSNPDMKVSGTVADLAKRYNMELTYFVGFWTGLMTA